MRKTRVIVAAALILVSLTGCDYLHHEYVDEKRDGGVTPEAAEATLMELDGITAANFSTESTYSPGEGGMFSSEGMDVELAVSVDPEWSIADPEAFLEFLAATSWSVNDHIPDGTVRIVITGGVDKLFDWTPVGIAVFEDPDPYSYFHGDPIAESSLIYGEHFGRWPSDPVDAPAGMLANVPPTITEVPALTGLTFVTEQDAVNEECLFVGWARGFGGLGQYPGTVAVTLLDAAGNLLELRTVPDDEVFTEFCFPVGALPVDPSVTVSSEELAGFSTVTETLTLP